MSRIRSIKPDFWSSEQVMALSRDARLLFIGIWNFADDYGRLKFVPMTIKAQVLPGDDVSRLDMDRWLKEIVDQKLMVLYTHGTDESSGGFANPREDSRIIHAAVTGWPHQRVSHPTPSKHPEPNDKLSREIPFPESSGGFANPREHSRLIRLDPPGIDPRREEGSAEGAAPVGADSLTLAAPVDMTPKPGPAKKPRSEPTMAAKSKTGLRVAVDRLAASYGHQAPPTASKAHWQLGAAKVAGLVAGGADLAESAERVAVAALERFRSGRSTSFGYALQDCVIGAEQVVPTRAGRVAPAAGTTGADFRDVDDFEKQLEKTGRTA